MGQKDADANNFAGALHALLAQIALQKGQRHVVLIASPASVPSLPDQAEADSLLAAAKSSGVQVHSLVIAETESPVDPRFRSLCEGSGGKMVRAAAVNEVAPALAALFGERSSSYEIAYVSNSAATASRLSVQVYSPQGCGELTLETRAIVPRESAIECPIPLESSAHSLTPDPALGS